MPIILLAGIDLYKGADIWHKNSDLTELQAEWQSYIWDTWTTRKEWWVSENVLWQEFSWGMEHIIYFKQDIACI